MKTLLKNLWLADGAGTPLKRCTVLVEDGRIAAVEPEIAGASAADRVLELGGKILAPGFIDVHGHSDLSLAARPEGFGKISQGITTEIMGNCGLSAFPLSEHNCEHLQKLWAQYGVELTWKGFSGWKRELEARGARLRAEALTGHNTLRAAVAGYQERELSGRQLEEMKHLLECELAAGSLGLSTGLLYVPGKFASPGEIVELMRIVARHDKIYATHLRSEGNELLESLDETIECARRSGLKRLQISHFKTAGKANWHKLDAALERIDAARASGISVTVDRYPYVESMTQLSVILPGKYGDMDDTSLMRALENPAIRMELARQLSEVRPAEYWQGVTLISTGCGKFRSDAGKPLSLLAQREHCTPPVLAVELLAADAPGTTAAFRGMSESNLERILALPYCMMGSDENARPADGSIGRCHPRGFGSAARFLRLRLEHGARIEEAVRQMTGLPAETFQLRDCGVIRPGNLADLVAFDPDGIDGTTNFADPHTPATGILLTMRAGEIIFR